MTTSNKMRIDLDPRLLANQTKILKYLAHITEEQKAQKQMLKTVMQETQKFQSDVYQSFKIVDHKIHKAFETVDNVEEMAEHINIRVKSIYKHMKGVGSNNDLLQSDSQSRMFNSLHVPGTRQQHRKSNEPGLGKQAIPSRVYTDFNTSGSDVDANEHEPEEVLGATSNVPFSNPPDLTKPLNSPEYRMPSRRNGKPKSSRTSNIQEPESLSSSPGPMPLASYPPQNTHRPNTRKPVYTKTLATEQSFLDTSVIKRAPRTKRRLIEANPSGKDIKKLAENNGFELSKASVTAVSEACKSSLASPPQTVGLHTVLVLDTSASMAGHSLNTLQTFVNGMLDGIDSSAGELGLEEHVAIVSCGASMQIQQALTNDYMTVRNKIDTLSSDGRTPLVGALALALCYLEIKGETLEMNSFKIPPRVVVVSDFQVTSDKTFTGQDSDTSELRINAQQQVFQIGRLFRRSGYPIYCVPVQDSNQTVCEELANISSGLVVPVNEPMMCGHFYRYQLVIGSAMEEYSLAMSSGNEEDVEVLISKYLPRASLNQDEHAKVYMLFQETLSRSEDNGDLDELTAETDQTHMSPHHGGLRIETPTSDVEEVPASFSPTNQLQATVTNQTQSRAVGTPYPEAAGQEGTPTNVSEQVPFLPEWILIPGLESVGFEERGDLPMFGSRVIRGPDWKWDNQDGNGLGTVVGHKEKGLLYIVWDNTNILGIFRYRHEGTKFDVDVQVGARRVPEGCCELGCWVVRGPDWQRGDEDGGEKTVGVVIRKLPDRKVMVRWPSRMIETYGFGSDNKWELAVTETKPIPMPAYESEPTDDMTLQERPSVLGEEENLPFWFWMDNSGQWRIFPEEANQKLESTFTIKPEASVMVHRKNQSIKVYFAQMQCEINDKRCRLERRLLPEGEIKSLLEIEDMLPDP